MIDLAIRTVEGMKRGAEECLGYEFVNQVKLVERIKAFDDVLTNLRIIAAVPTAGKQALRIAELESK